MFYVCKKREDGTYGVMDTVDGIVEYYSPKELIRVASRFRVEIKGLINKGNNQWGIKVLEPTQFTDISSDILNESTGKVHQSSDNSCNNSDVDYREYYSKLSPHELSKIYGVDLSLRLAKVINDFTGLCYHGEVMDLLDGIDCIGYDNISLGSGYSISVYCNPDFTSGTELRSDGFGLDVFKDNKLLDDGHFDSSFEDYLDDVQSFKYNYLFRAL